METLYVVLLIGVNFARVDASEGRRGLFVGEGREIL